MDEIEYEIYDAAAPADDIEDESLPNATRFSPEFVAAYLEHPDEPIRVTLVTHGPSKPSAE
jgi:hypothetical protein